MDMKKFKTEYPDIAAALTAEGHAQGITEGADKAKADGLKAGADAERARIQAVLTLAFDGKSTAAEAAVQILAAEKTKRGNVLGALKSEGAQLAAVPAGSLADPSALDKPDDSHLPIEERCKANWDKNPAIRGEFSTLATYTAYEKAVASGRVKVLGKRSA
jgi:hypothetical protein